MTAEVVKVRTIQRVMKEFLEWREPTLDPDELAAYRETIARFEDSVNAQGSPGGRLASEVLGSQKIPSAIGGFIERFVDVSGPTVLAELCSWLVWNDYVSESEMEEAIDSLGALFLDPTDKSVNV